MRGSAVISSKGQLVIPAELRKKYGLHEGVRVIFEEDSSGRLALQASNFEAVYALQGIGRAFPLDEALEEDRRRAQYDEDAR